VETGIHAVVEWAWELTSQTFTPDYGIEKDSIGTSPVIEDRIFIYYAYLNRAYPAMRDYLCYPLNRR